MAWPEIFGREAPMELEIGCGYGHFLLELASARPEHDFVAIEIRRKLAEGLARKAERRGLSNLVSLHGDARQLLPVLFAPERLQAIHVLFPDPWWKKRHHKRRLVDTAFAHLAHLLLVPGGLLYLRTDILDYARAMIATFEDGSGRFENLHGPACFARDDGLPFPSNRERRYLASGTPVYRLVYRRLT